MPASASAGAGPGWATPGAVDTDDVDEADGRRVPADQRRGQAFCALLEAVDPDRLPAARRHRHHRGGDHPLRRPRRRAGVGTLGDGTRISASEVRRLACTAGILPAVLDGNSEVLDLGRTRRLFSAAQRKALAIQPAHLPRRRLHGAVDLVRSPPRRRPLVPAVAAPTSPTGCCSAPGTTTASTTTATSSRTRPTAESASTDGRRPTATGSQSQVGTSYRVAGHGTARPRPRRAPDGRVSEARR